MRMHAGAMHLDVLVQATLGLLKLFSVHRANASAIAAVHWASGRAATASGKASAELTRIAGSTGNVSTWGMTSHTHPVSSATARMVTLARLG